MMKLPLHLSLVALCTGILCSCGEGEQASTPAEATAEATAKAAEQKVDLSEQIRKEIDTYKAELAAVDTKKASGKLLDMMILPSDYVKKAAESLEAGNVELFKLIVGGGDWAMAPGIGSKEAMIKTFGFDLLRKAGYCSHPEVTPETMVKWVLAAGVDVNATNDEGVTALEYFAQNTAIAHTLYLLGAKTDNPLMTAVIGGDVEAVKSELAKGADVNVQSSYNSATPMMLACINPDTTILSMLIAKGADVHKAPNPKMYTPIQAAVNTSNLAAFKVLLDAGAGINDLSNGRTLLHIAGRSVKNENGVEIIKLLIAKGMDVNMRATDAGFTPLMDLLYRVNPKKKDDKYTAQLAALKVLLEAGADPTLTTNSGKSTKAMLDNAELAPEFTQLLDAAPSK